MSSQFNVNLFCMVTSCGIVGAFIPLLVKMILQIITRETEIECSLRRQVCDLKAELGSISMVDEFAKYAKIKRKINKASDELSHQSDVRSLYKLKMRFIASVVLYCFMSCCIIFLVWNYRTIAIAVLPENWLYPFGSLLSYPSGVSGGISLTSWLFICGTVGRLMAKSLKV